MCVKYVVTNRKAGRYEAKKQERNQNHDRGTRVAKEVSHLVKKGKAGSLGSAGTYRSGRCGDLAIPPDRRRWIGNDRDL